MIRDFSSTNIIRSSSIDSNKCRILMPNRCTVILVVEMYSNMVGIINKDNKHRLISPLLETREYKDNTKISEVLSNHWVHNISSSISSSDKHRFMIGIINKQIEIVATWINNSKIIKQEKVSNFVRMTHVQIVVLVSIRMGILISLCIKNYVKYISNFVTNCTSLHQAFLILSWIIFQTNYYIKNKIAFNYYWVLFSEDAIVECSIWARANAHSFVWRFVVYKSSSFYNSFC